MTAAQHIAAVERIFNLPATAPNILDARRHLKAVPTTAPESARARELEKQADDKYAVLVVNAEKLQKQRAAERKKKLDDYARLISKRHEAAQQTTWYSPKGAAWRSGEGGSFRIYPYIGKDDSGHKWLRLKASLTRDDWVFVESIRFVIDGNPVTLELNRYKDLDTEVSGGSIYEYVDVSDQDVLIHSLANAKIVLVSFQGQHRRANYKFAQADFNNFKNMLAFYEEL